MFKGRSLRPSFWALMLKLVDCYALLRILIIMDISITHLNTVGAEELAQILKIKTRSLHARLVRQPESLPAPVQRGNGTRLLWLACDVKNWLESGGVKK